MSIYLEGDRALLGVTATGWADVARRRAAVPTVVSRAEHKLAKPSRPSNLNLIPGCEPSTSAPPPVGGSHLLAALGLEVVAVDPAELNAWAAKHPRVTHVRSRAEDADLPDAAFDLLTNDMVMDPADSAAATVRLARVLKPGGRVVMTLKLPFRSPWPSIRRARAVVEPTNEAVAMRHLPHNRHEVTALLRRR